jgi:hypothetical protein
VTPILKESGIKDNMNLSKQCVQCMERISAASANAAFEVFQKENASIRELLNKVSHDLELSVISLNLDLEANKRRDEAGQRRERVLFGDENLPGLVVEVKGLLSFREMAIKGWWWVVAGVVSLLFLCLGGAFAVIWAHVTKL